MKVDKVFLVSCSLMAIVYAGVCAVDVMMHAHCPYYPDDHLFLLAKDKILQFGVEDLQKQVDEYFAENDSSTEVSCEVLNSLIGELPNAYCAVREMDRFAHPEHCLTVRFGTHSNYSWLVAYSSKADVKSVRGVRWVSEHIGVRDNFFYGQ